jgi:hypothetical protein
MGPHSADNRAQKTKDMQEKPANKLTIVIAAIECPFEVRKRTALRLGAHLCDLWAIGNSAFAVQARRLDRALA